MNISSPLDRAALAVSLFALSGCAAGGAERGSASDDGVRDVRGGFPVAVLARADLQRLVEAGLERRSAPLVEALADDDAAVRQTAAHALASVQDSAAGSQIERLLADGVPAVRAAAAFALGQLGSAADAARLVAALQDEQESRVRVALLEAIGKSADASVLRGLLQLLDDAFPSADRYGAALALFHAGRRGIADRRGVEILLDLTASDDEPTAMTAALALAGLRDPAAFDVGPDVLRAALARIPADSRAAGPLLRMIGQSGAPNDGPLLLRRLAGGRPWNVRVAAAMALAASHAPAEHADIAAALLAALDDPSPHVAFAAADALARSTAGSGSDSLRDLLAERTRAHMSRPFVAAALLPALAGTSHESLIITWARGETSASRMLAWPALARVSAPQADSILLHAFSGDRREVYAAAAVLARKLASKPGDTALHAAAIPLMTRRLPLWGPYAPASDVRGAVQLLDQLLTTLPSQTRALRSQAAIHPHADIRAAAARAGDTTHAVPSPRQKPDWDRLRSAGSRPRIDVRTTAGNFVLEVYPELAPLAVSALLDRVEEGDFDGLSFHRVEPDFILQSGDFDNPLGYGGPSVGLRSELNQLRFAPGVLGMASAGKDTEGSQYFITHNHAPSLDGRYGAFGRIISGADVADRITTSDSVIAMRIASRYRRAASTAR